MEHLIDSWLVPVCGGIGCPWQQWREEDRVDELVKEGGYYRVKWLGQSEQLLIDPILQGGDQCSQSERKKQYQLKVRTTDLGLEISLLSPPPDPPHTHSPPLPTHTELTLIGMPCFLKVRVLTSW